MRILMMFLYAGVFVLAGAVELAMEVVDHACYWGRKEFRPLYWLSLVVFHPNERKGYYR